LDERLRRLERAACAGDPDADAELRRQLARTDTPSRRAPWVYLERLPDARRPDGSPEPVYRELTHSREVHAEGREAWVVCVSSPSQFSCNVRAYRLPRGRQPVTTWGRWGSRYGEHLDLGSGWTFNESGVPLAAQRLILASLKRQRLRDWLRHHYGPPE
jgi:hypothetical protein